MTDELPLDDVPMVMEVPRMDWVTEEQVIRGDEFGVVWWTRLDDRYQIEVHRDEPYRGRLLMFDREDGGRCVYRSGVGLAYDAMFGPDVADVDGWQAVALKVADGR